MEVHVGLILHAILLAGSIFPDGGTDHRASPRCVGGKGTGRKRTGTAADGLYAAMIAMSASRAHAQSKYWQCVSGENYECCLFKEVLTPQCEAAPSSISNLTGPGNEAFLSVLCADECLPDLYRFYYRCVSADVAEYFAGLCSANQKGPELCGRYLELTNSFANDSRDAYVTCVFGNIFSLDPETNCTKNCVESLSDVISDRYGCCFATLWGGSLFNFYPDLTNASLWETCGVNYTGRCPYPSSLEIIVPTASSARTSIMSIHELFSLLASLVLYYDNYLIN